MKRSPFSLLFIILGLLLLSAGSVAAAEIIEEEIFFVAAETVIEEDLYVSANELLLDGVVEGDVIFLGSYAEINGEIKGDFMALAAGVEINGRVADDARILGASLVIPGEIGDDLLAVTGGGGAPVQTPFSSSTRVLLQGVYMRGGQIGGDAIFAGGLADLSGTIKGGLSGVISNLTMRDLLIEGSADVEIAEITVDEESRVAGERGFSYRAPAPLNVPSSLSELIVFDQIEAPPINWFVRLRRALGALAGFALLGYLLLRYRPQWLIAPAAIMTASPGRCFLTGLIAAASSVLLIFIAGVLVTLFWGGLSGLAAAGLLFFGLILTFTLSPLIAGIWVGQRLSRQPFQAMLIGAALIVGLTIIPAVGTGFALVTFLFALGGLIHAPRMTQLPPQV